MDDLIFLSFYLHAGVASAFAAKDILGNVFSGVSMQFSKPFSIGDTIKVCWFCRWKLMIGPLFNFMGKLFSEPWYRHLFCTRMLYLQLCFSGDEWQLFFTYCTLGNNIIVALFQWSNTYYVVCSAYIDVVCTSKGRIKVKTLERPNK